MIVIVSPAKSLDTKKNTISSQFSIPEFLNVSKDVVHILKDYSPKKLSSLMNISSELAHLNYNRFQAWNIPFNQTNAKQAIFSFSGDVYTGFDAYSLSETSIVYAQSHLKILSGLYGILKPLDLIQAYRLEMGTKLPVGTSKNLYSLWKNTLTKSVNDAIRDTQSKNLVNLASNEYSKAIQFKDISANIITPVFKDWKNGQYKMISFFAKKARGLMARYIMENQIKHTEDLKDFNVDGYVFNEELSESTPFTFTRENL